MNSSYALYFISIVVICVDYHNAKSNVAKQLESGLVGHKSSSVHRVHCIIPQLDICQDFVRYPVPRILDRLHRLQEGQVSALLFSFSAISLGSSASCERQLTRLFCREKFPRCHGDMVDWGQSHEECVNVASLCPPSVKRHFHTLGICDKLTEGSVLALRCTPPMLPKTWTECKANDFKKVSPWLVHSGLEIDGLLNLQYSTWNTTMDCKRKFSSYACTIGNYCWTAGNDVAIIRRYKEMCTRARLACGGDQLGAAVKEIYFSCPVDSVLVI